MTNPETTTGPTTTASEWVDRLTILAAELRPDWGKPGIRSALLKVSDKPLQHVALAVVAACGRVDQRTPAVIAMDGPHWRLVPDATPPAPPRVPPALRCDLCDKPREECERRNGLVAAEHQHEFTPRRARRDAAGTRMESNARDNLAASPEQPGDYVPDAVGGALDNLLQQLPRDADDG